MLTFCLTFCFRLGRFDCGKKDIQKLLLITTLKMFDLLFNTYYKRKMFISSEKKLKI